MFGSGGVGGGGGGELTSDNPGGILEGVRALVFQETTFVALDGSAAFGPAVGSPSTTAGFARSPLVGGAMHPGLPRREPHYDRTVDSLTVSSGSDCSDLGERLGGLARAVVVVGEGEGAALAGGGRKGAGASDGSDLEFSSTSTGDL